MGSEMSNQEKKMTIERAKQFYAKYGDAFQADTNNMVTLIRASGYNEPLANSNYMHALCYTDAMFQHTSHEFRMLTASATDFIECLQDSFKAMLNRIKKNKGKARIVIVDGDKSQALEKIENEYDGTLKIIEAVSSSNSPIAHFIVCDDDMVRDEAPHKPLTKESDADVITAEVYFRNNIKADIISQKFDQIWKSLKERMNQAS